MNQDKNAGTYQESNVVMFLSKNVEMYQENNAEMFQSKSVRRFQSKNAKTYLDKLVEQYQNNNAQTFLAKNVNKNARIYFGAKFVLKFLKPASFETIFYSISTNYLCIMYLFIQLKTNFVF